MTVNINAASISSARFVEQASNPATPSSGSVRLFVDNSTVYNNTLSSNTPLLKMIADDGTVTTFIGNVTTSGVGITFPPQQVASSNANTLDDYEEGKWDPSYTTESGNLPSVTYGDRVGRYVKIGSHVTAWFVIQTHAITPGTLSNYAMIGGLPFATANITTFYCSGSIGVTINFGVNFPSSIVANLSDTRAYLYYRDSPDGATSLLQVSDLRTTSYSNLLYGVISYLSAA